MDKTETKEKNKNIRIYYIGLLNRQENIQLSVGLACENSWLPWLFAASYVLPGGAFVLQHRNSTLMI